MLMCPQDAQDPLDDLENSQFPPSAPTSGSGTSMRATTRGGERSPVDTNQLSEAETVPSTPKRDDKDTGGSTHP
jgi:hypothetical protein